MCGENKERLCAIKCALNLSPFVDTNLICLEHHFFLDAGANLDRLRKGICLTRNLIMKTNLQNLVVRLIAESSRQSLTKFALLLALLPLVLRAGDPVPQLIIGNASQALVSVTAADSEAMEPLVGKSNPGVFIIKRTGSTDFEMPVYLSFSGTAQPGIDYEKIKTPLIIPKGKASIELIVTPLADKALEKEESVIIKIEHPVCPKIFPPPATCYALAASSEAKVVIHDSSTNPSSPTGKLAIESPKPFAEFKLGAILEVVIVAVDVKSYIHRVELYSNDQKVGVSELQFITAPKAGEIVRHMIRWSGAKTGKNVLYAKAKDSSGFDVISDSVTVSVSSTPNPESPAKIELLNPKTGTSVSAGGDLGLVAVATDPKGVADKVIFIANDKVVGESQLKFPRPESPGKSYTHEFVWKKIAAGSYLVVAVMVDSKGNRITSSPSRVEAKEVTVASTAIRELPDHYSPREEIIVVIKVTPARGTLAYAIEETPPADWKVGEISQEGVFDSKTGKVKFGPFFDSSAKTLRYAIRPNDQLAEVKFSGVFASGDQLQNIIGDSILKGASRLHPADVKPSDNAISLLELTSYGAAWKSGTASSMPPNPIPANYVTKAAALWKAGEKYEYNPAVGAAPNCWIPVGSSIRPASLSAASGTGDSDRQSFAAPVSAESIVNKGLGDLLVIQLMITPRLGSAALAVEEFVPDGWDLAGIQEDGFYDPSTRRIRWLFLDDTRRSLSYQIRPSHAGSGSGARLAGIVSVDGDDSVISGQRTLLSSATSVASSIRKIRKNEKGLMELEIQTTPGQRSRLEVSDNLKNWEVIASGETTEVVEYYRDEDSGIKPLRFYRLRPEPEISK